MATPYQSLFKSFYDKFKTATGAGEASTLLGGRLYEGYAPEKHTLPYAVLQLTGGAQDDTFETVGERQNWMFTVVGAADLTGDPVGAVLAILDAIRTLFDHSSLSAAGGDFTGYSVSDLRAGSVSGPVWQDGLVIASLPYTIIVQET